jgi:hypothetical protein
MEPVARESIAARIERVERLDALSEPLQRGVRAAIPQESVLIPIPITASSALTSRRERRLVSP